MGNRVYKSALGNGYRSLEGLIINSYYVLNNEH